MDEQKATRKTKACPRCFEEVNEDAEVCRYCLSRIGNAKDGQLVKVRIKVGEKSYQGDLFVAKTERLSDTINDARNFIILSSAKEEGKLTDISVGFLALNKNSVESVRLCGSEEANERGEIRQIY